MGLCKMRGIVPEALKLFFCQYAHTPLFAGVIPEMRWHIVQHLPIIIVNQRDKLVQGRDDIRYISLVHYQRFGKRTGLVDE